MDQKKSLTYSMQPSGGGGGREATAYFSSTRYRSSRSCSASWDRIIRRIPASLTWATSLQPPPLPSSLFPLAGQKDVRKRSFENGRQDKRKEKEEDERIATERRRRIKIIKFHSVNHLLTLCGILAALFVKKWCVASSSNGWDDWRGTDYTLTSETSPRCKL